MKKNKKIPLTPEEKKIINRLRVLQKRSTKIWNEQVALKKKLQSICNHSDFKEEKAYDEGTYLVRSIHTTWKECNICGTSFDYNVKYGGYGRKIS